MPKYVASIDQGTTSTRCILFDHAGDIVAIDQKEHQQIYPKPDWVEHDALEIWENTQEVMRGVLQKADAISTDVAAIGITNQRETALVWEKATGRPVYNAIVWQDTRTDTICNELAKNDGQDRFRPTTGLPLATINLLVKAGTLQDPQGKEGLANLTASLLLSGTKKRSATQIAGELDFLGAKLGASGGDDFAQLSLTVLKKDLAAGLELFQDVLLHPAFAPAEVTRKVAQIQASLESDEDEPGVVAARTFNKDLFGAFP